MTFRNLVPAALTVVALARPVAAVASQPRTVELRVTQKGFEPSRVKLAKGEPVRLIITRKTDDTCAKQVVIPDESIKVELPLDKAVTVTFTPKRAGEIRYSCAMGMVGGVLDVR